MNATRRQMVVAAGSAVLAGCATPIGDAADWQQFSAGDGSDSASLVRQTPACRPKSIDLSQSSDCDFIGQQQGSLCMLPFPDDYYTVADQSTGTGRRIDFHAAGMPKNAASVPINPSPYSLNASESGVSRHA